MATGGERARMCRLPQIKSPGSLQGQPTFSHFPNVVGRETHSVLERRSTFGDRCYDSCRKLWPLEQTSTQCASSLAPSSLSYWQREFVKCVCGGCGETFHGQLFSFLGRFRVSSHEGNHATFRSTR